MWNTLVVLFLDPRWLVFLDVRGQLQILSTTLFDVDRRFPVAPTHFVGRRDISIPSTLDDQPTLVDSARWCCARTEAYLSGFPWRGMMHLLPSRARFGVTAEDLTSRRWFGSAPFHFPLLTTNRPHLQTSPRNMQHLVNNHLHRFLHKKNTHILRKRYYDSLR